MLFNSFIFIFLFLPLVLCAYFNLRSHRICLFMLLGASYFFYGYWNYRFVPLLLFSTALDFYLGIKIHEAKTPNFKKRLLLLSVIINLGLLGFFKYFNFFLDTLQTITGGQISHALWIKIILPIGISFYTFISLSYTIDVYLKRCEPYRDFFSYAGFVSFFPHLIAGPLIRHDELVFQLEDEKRARFNPENFSQGIILFLLGLSKKTLIADRLADAINPALTTLPLLSMVEAWLCAIGYAFQLYFDFSAYSDMAVGLAQMMNIRFPQNFRSPYKASSITDFWKRWHISLSRWLRDYLYIPLGGSYSNIFLTYRNLFLTMLLGGLWHGAHWVFIIWGGFHGLLLALERAARGRLTLELPTPLKRGLTFFLVVIGWVFFRSPNLSFAKNWFSKLFPAHLSLASFTLHHFEPKYRDRFFIALLLAIGISWGAKNTFDLNLSKWITPRIAWAMAALLVTCLTFFSKNTPFLYFQF